MSALVVGSGDADKGLQTPSANPPNVVSLGVKSQAITDKATQGLLMVLDRLQRPPGLASG